MVSTTELAFYPLTSFIERGSRKEKAMLDRSATVALLDNSVVPDQLGNAIQEMRAQWRALRAWWGYRPEHHYMRGAQSSVQRPDGRGSATSDQEISS
jgi:hypothetical protein